ncbi:putative phosphoglucomutase [Fusobacterium equinum]|uniref:Putative phosphoglucomutase n=1 Tax=Fusobacterium equinum TaxID=134605 RepID=A0A133NJP6_9FUSO|nr:phospho-sugar mutase [Fusobacterium equinum]KXA16477.1 putative phosphoglucomutase [Fusobacterium equinum]
MELNWKLEYEKWLHSSLLSEDEKKELQAISSDEIELENRFYTDLSFGTAGMRGIRGIGRNRMNRYNVGKASQGLANYILKMTGEEGKKRGVAIAYDCRIDSEENAETTARVLAANGIKAYVFESLRSTPELSFATRELRAQAGVMITASHNPKEYNGYKVYWEDGAQIVEPQASGIVDSVNAVDVFQDVKTITLEEAKKQGLFCSIGKSIDDRFIEEVEKNAIHREISGKENFPIVYSPLHGTGRVAVQRVLKEMGFLNVHTVAEQELPDGTFPTCPYANPEDHSVFQLSLDLADKVGAKLCIANDPDADRTGIAFLDKEGKWYIPNGNQIGILLANYIFTNKKIPKNGAVISTIVSTPMLDPIAKAYGITLYRTLTGFKYIGEKIRQFEQKELDGVFLFGFEEAIGYLSGTHVRDKDAVVTSMLVAEMAAYYDAQGSSLYEELLKLYDKFGYYLEETIAITKKGKHGLEAIANTMKKLREIKPTVLCGQKVLEIRDFNENYNGLPKSNVLQYVLEDGSQVTVRPSGTEPKIKYYICVSDKVEVTAKEKLNQFKKSFQDYVNAL